MRDDSARMRPGKPFLFTNCMTGEGIDELVEMLLRMVLFDKPLHDCGMSRPKSSPSCGI
jgi:urease accessory protein